MTDYIFIIGADPVGFGGPDPTKLWSLGILWLGPHENFTEINLISAKSIPGAAF